MAFRDRLREIIRIRESPHRVALSFSTGIFIGMSPLLGVHTLLAVLVAWAFRLNTFAIIAGVFITNPWTVIPIYTFNTWIGAKCLGTENIIPQLNWSNITLSNIFNTLKPLLMPFIFGSFLVGSITAIISYIFIYRVIKKEHRLSP